MLNVECDVCGKEGTVEFEDSDYENVFTVKCPHCGAEIDLAGNEFFYELNIDDEEYERMMANGGI